MNLSRSIALVLALMMSSAIAAPPPGVPQETPTPETYFVTGQRLSRCAAFYELASEQAKALHLSASETSLQDTMRGWSLAGMFLMKGGALEQQFDAPRTARDIQATELTKLHARLELGDAANTLQRLGDENARDCASLVAVQEAVIAAMRSGSK